VRPPWYAAKSGKISTSRGPSSPLSFPHRSPRRARGTSTNARSRRFTVVGPACLQVQGHQAGPFGIRAPAANGHEITRSSPLHVTATGESARLPASFFSCAPNGDRAKATAPAAPLDRVRPSSGPPGAAGRSFNRPRRPSPRLSPLQVFAASPWWAGRAGDAGIFRAGLNPEWVHSLHVPHSAQIHDPEVSSLLSNSPPPRDRLDPQRRTALCILWSTVVCFHPTTKRGWRSTHRRKSGAGWPDETVQARLHSPTWETPGPLVYEDGKPYKTT